MLSTLFEQQSSFSFHQSMFKREHHRYADLADDGERSIGLT